MLLFFASHLGSRYFCIWMFSRMYKLKYLFSAKPKIKKVNQCLSLTTSTRTFLSTLRRAALNCMPRLCACHNQGRAVCVLCKCTRQLHEAGFLGNGAVQSARSPSRCAGWNARAFAFHIEASVGSSPQYVGSVASKNEQPNAFIIFCLVEWACNSHISCKVRFVALCDIWPAKMKIARLWLTWNYYILNIKTSFILSRAPQWAKCVDSLMFETRINIAGVFCLKFNSHFRSIQYQKSLNRSRKISLKCTSHLKLISKTNLIIISKLSFNFPFTCNLQLLSVQILVTKL